MSASGRLLRRLPIRQKLVVAMLASSGLALLVAGGGMITYELAMFRKAAVNQLATLAEIIGANNTGALVFNDPVTAQTTLDTLRDQRSIVAARIYNEAGQPFATYLVNGADQRLLPASPQPDVHNFSGGNLHVTRSIMLRGDRIGVVYLVSDLAWIRARVVRYLSIVLLAMLALFVLILFLSLRIQRFISDPILHLAAVAKRVAEKRDFSARAPEVGEDEIGVLSTTFNQMLETIEARDSALRNANHILQAEVNERRRAEAELQQSRYRLELAQKVGAIGTFEWDIATGKVTWTEDLEALYGLAPATFAGTYAAWEGLIFPDDIAKVNAAIETAMAAKSDFEVEFRIRRTDGAVRWMACRARIFFDDEGHALGVLGINMDITVRKEAEQKLTQQAEDLWRSNRELEQFAYVSSHDLKEPLRKIASYTELLAQRYQGQLDADADKFIAYVLNGVRRMQNLIQDLLAYSKAGKEDLKREPVDLNRLCQQAIIDLEPLIGEANAEVEVGRLPVVQGHAAQLHQVIQNLLSNALKFRGPGRPRVNISAERTGSEWEITVRDNGIGIEPQYAEQIFKIFQRLHTATEYPGTGIGLAICKKIVERHGGRIWVDSLNGKGSAFHFTLPA